jgi:hypothetical protein
MRAAKRKRDRRSRLTLQAALEGSYLANHVRLGLEALLRRDVGLIAEGERRKVADSIDLDEATREAHPNVARWDYLLSVTSRPRLVGLEPHSAKDSEVSVVIAKRRNSLEHLRGELLPQYRVSDWYWVSHGAVSFSNMESARRRMNQNGITFVGRTLRSLD